MISSVQRSADVAAFTEAIEVMGAAASGDSPWHITTADAIAARSEENK